MNVENKKAIARFNEVLPELAKEVVSWTPQKDGSIKVELSRKRFYFFNYVDDRTWRLETARAHINDEKKGA